MRDWTEARPADIRVGDQTAIDGNWCEITAVAEEGDHIVIYLGSRRIAYPRQASIMVRTAEDRDAVRRRDSARMAAFYAASEPWYLKLLNKWTDR